MRGLLSVWWPIMNAKPKDRRSVFTNLPGLPLIPQDLARLEQCAIPREVAEQAMLRRVDSAEGG